MLLSLPKIRLLSSRLKSRIILEEIEKEKPVWRIQCSNIVVGQRTTGIERLKSQPHKYLN